MVSVAVVGAGLSGLTTARRLARAGADVVVLEARDRIGGRAWRLDVDGLPFHAGCEAIDDAHRRVLALAEELDVPTWRSERWGGDEELPELLAALEQEVAALAARLDPAHPEDVDGAAALDAQTLRAWLVDRGGDANVLAAAELHYAVASSGVPTGEMSLLAYAAKQAAGAAPNGLALRFRGGATALAERLAAGCEVRTSAVVTAIEQGASGVRIRLADGAGVGAARAILAVPLTVQRDIRFDPPLPEHRRLAFVRARYGEVVKAALPYADDRTRALPELSPDGLLYQPDPDVRLLALFAGASAAARARRLDTLAAVDWTREPFSCGSYLIFGPGDLTTWGRRLAEPHGRVHFAGSEASELPSYIEGAVSAGERAAAEVLAAG